MRAGQETEAGTGGDELAIRRLVAGAQHELFALPWQAQCSETALDGVVAPIAGEPVAAEVGGPPRHAGDLALKRALAALHPPRGLSGPALSSTA